MPGEGKRDAFAAASVEIHEESSAQGGSQSPGKAVARHFHGIRSECSQGKVSHDELSRRTAGQAQGDASKHTSVDRGLDVPRIKEESESEEEMYDDELKESMFWGGNVKVEKHEDDSDSDKESAMDVGEPGHNAMVRRF